MACQHVWQKEPPDAISRTSEDNYEDKRDMAHNSFWTSLEELKRLWLLLDEDPEFEKSSDWPVLVEWCSSCGSTRGVKLVLPKKFKEPGLEVEESTSEVSSCCDASTQTPRQRPRRRGGRGSRTRRMLAYQLMLTVKQGLPLSRLLSRQKTEPRSSMTELQEEFALPPLKVKEEVEIKEEKQEEVAKLVKEEKEEESCRRKEVSSSGSTHFTLRSFSTGSNPPSTQPLPHGPCLPPSPVVSPPLFTPPWIPFLQPQQFGQMPVASWVVCGGCQMWGTVVPFWAAQ